MITESLASESEAQMTTLEEMQQWDKWTISGAYNLDKENV